jgi:glycosyltransferase involved in cell wall biosynthesis
MVELVAQEAAEFDIVHFHIDYLHFPVTRRERLTAVTTLHGRLDIPDIHPLFQEFPDMNLVSISDAQRAPMPWANWVGTVHHGIPEDLYVPQEQPGKYLAFIGRISPEKRVDRAIAVAKRLGIPLKIAAKVDASDREYFESEIRNLMDDPLIEYVGEISDEEKSEFLGNAYALLFLIDWEEPFGLAMAEAIACGTPVIAYGSGSVPEVIDDGVTGYIVDSIEGAADAVQRIEALDRRLIRHIFEKRFSARRMCLDYVEIYRKLRDREPDLTAGESLSSAL